uniref:Uncharacterized protein n=1 Tax=Rhipicephalus pulchellus TaxID=72859 RepID=L7LY41_RHIPC
MVLHGQVSLCAPMPSCFFPLSFGKVYTPFHKRFPGRCHSPLWAGLNRCDSPKMHCRGCDVSLCTPGPSPAWPCSFSPVKRSIDCLNPTFVRGEGYYTTVWRQQILSPVLFLDYLCI